MAKDTIIVKDRNFRISLSEPVRVEEDIRVGDIIEIDVTNLSKGKRGEKELS
jgi:hypothetical protein